MNYQQIKLELSKAGKLIDVGDVAEADALIHALLGKGLTLQIWTPT